jgi:diguanylate cyclase (GGDEF)-like protein
MSVNVVTRPLEINLESFSADLKPQDFPPYVTGMEKLLTAVQSLSLARDMETIQSIVSSAARSLTMCDGATIILQDEEYCYYADEEAIEPLWKGKRFPMVRCISGWVMKNKTPAVIQDIYSDDRIPFEAYRPTFVKSLAVVPIRSHSPIGAIGNYWAHGHQATDVELKLLQALADLTSIAIDNVQLYQHLEERVRIRTAELEAAYERIEAVSLTDDLTGLYNRRGFYQIAERLFSAAAREKKGCTLIYMDLDGLKAINDAYGHKEGDKLIQKAAQVLINTLRKHDLAARMGGDEFAVLVKGCVGNELISRLNAEIDQLNASQETYHLQASVGHLEIPVCENPRLFEWLADVDARMYQDKKTKKSLAKFIATES